MRTAAPGPSRSNPSEGSPRPRRPARSPAGGHLQPQPRSTGHLQPDAAAAAGRHLLRRGIDANHLLQLRQDRVQVEVSFDQISGHGHRQPAGNVARRAQRWQRGSAAICLNRPATGPALLLPVALPSYAEVRCAPIKSGCGWRGRTYMGRKADAPQVFCVHRTGSVTTHTTLLRRYSRSHDTVVAAVADNCRFDERASSDRWRQFDSLIAGLVAGRAVTDWQDWTEANQLHLDQKCNVASTSVPDALLEINRNAWLNALSENQSLVRIEALPRALAGSALNLDDLTDLLDQSDEGDKDADRAVGLFFDTWNQRRDARPTFAAFYDEVKQEADHDDWPHALRDRLGLGHYGYAGKVPLPVALMCYPLADVLSSQTRQQLAIACAVPTVLDDGMHEFFFPVPAPAFLWCHRAPSTGSG